MKKLAMVGLLVVAVLVGFNTKVNNFQNIIGGATGVTFFEKVGIQHINMLGGQSLMFIYKHDDTAYRKILWSNPINSNIKSDNNAAKNLWEQAKKDARAKIGK